MDNRTDFQADFKRAWQDLDQRINDGIANLRDMAQRASADNQERLSEKAEGLVDALTVWLDLSQTSMARSGDYAGMWRTFTDQVTNLLHEDGQSSGRYQGIHLALTYQRGYGEHIDAPAIPNPHV